MPQGSEIQISHKTSKKYFKNIQKSITELLHLAAPLYAADNCTARDIHNFGPFWLSKFKGGGNAPLAPLIKISLRKVVRTLSVDNLR